MSLKLSRPSLIIFISFVSFAIVNWVQLLHYGWQLWSGPPWLAGERSLFWAKLYIAANSTLICFLFYWGVVVIENLTGRRAQLTKDLLQADDKIKDLEAHPGWRVYAINDGLWWLALSKEEAIEQCRREGFDDVDDPDDVHPLSMAQLRHFQYWDTEDQDPRSHDHWRCSDPACGAVADSNCRWNGQAYEHPHPYPLGHVAMVNIHRRSFAEELDRHLRSRTPVGGVFAVAN